MSTADLFTRSDFFSRDCGFPFGFAPLTQDGVCLRWPISTTWQVSGKDCPRIVTRHKFLQSSQECHSDLSSLWLSPLVLRRLLSRSFAACVAVVLNTFVTRCFFLWSTVIRRRRKCTSQVGHLRFPLTCVSFPPPPASSSSRKWLCQRRFDSETYFRWLRARRCRRLHRCFNSVPPNS